MIRIIRPILIIIVTFMPVVAAFSGCGKKGPSPEEIRSNASIGKSDEISKLNDQLFGAANLSSDRGEYLLGPGDLLEIKVFEADKLNSTVRISSRGFASLPLLGEIKLDGLTAAEAEKLIEDTYRKTYIRNPNVNIFVKEHHSQRITVVGQVKNPGTYDFPSQIRLLDTIALAGGLTEKAGHSVQIKRLSSATLASEQTFVANLEKLINEGKTELNIRINGGDIVFIPEAGTFYVDGAVRRPGQYHIKKLLTINEAILASGGFAPYANTEKVILMREEENGVKREIELNLENPSSTDGVQVADGDIIYVNASFWRKMFSGGGINIGIPGLGVSYRDPSR